MQVVSEAMAPAADGRLPHEPAAGWRAGRSCRGWRAGVLLCVATLLGGSLGAQGMPAAVSRGIQAPAAQPQALPEDLEPDDAAAPVAASAAVAELTLSLLGFVRWPGDPPEVRLCLIGRTPHAGSLLEARQRWPRRGRRILARQRAPVDAARDCDALYLGRLSASQHGALLRQAALRGHLVISEQPRHCRQGGMVCLDLRRTPPGFVVDAQALARSGVRLHPQVLQLGLQQQPVSSP